MAALSTLLLAGGLALGAAGVATQMSAASKAADAQKQAEAERQKQMGLDADRRRRQVIREQVAARSQALSTATNQGAAQGSALEGAYGGIAGQAGTQTVAINQNEAIGNRMFQINSDLADDYRQNAMGSAMTSLGGLVLNNAGTLNRVGTYFSNKMFA